jgi:hypothetical protein
MLRKLMEIFGLIKPEYVSDADKFLQKFDREHPERSLSQQVEVEKHRDIFRRKPKDRIEW